MLLGLHVNRVHAGAAPGSELRSERGRGKAPPPKRPSMAKHVEAARLQAEKEGVEIKSVSMFIAGPRKQENLIGPEESKELKEYLDASALRAIAHGTYADYPWNGNPHAAQFIRQEADAGYKAGISGLVVHLPNKPVETVLKYLPRIYPAAKLTIYLEMVAVSPAKSEYETPQKLRKLFQAIREKTDPTLLKTGLCIDTAHLWSCGVDISDRKSAEKWLNELESFSDVIPPSKIMLHLNDSLYPLGAGKDAHAPLMRGKIWESYREKPSESGLAAFVDYADAHTMPVILERKPPEALAGDYRELYGLTESVRVKPAALELEDTLEAM